VAGRGIKAVASSHVLACWKIVFLSKIFFQKYIIWGKNSQFRGQKLRGKVEILSSHNLSCWKIADSCRKVATSCSNFFTHDAADWQWSNCAVKTAYHLSQQQLLFAPVSKAPIPPGDNRIHAKLSVVKTQ